MQTPMQTWVINLDRSTARLDSFARINAGIMPIARFPAIDGQTLTREALVAERIIDPALAYSPGALGCALSHANLWRHARALGQPITVFEDDAILHREFPRLAGELLGKAADCYDLVLWGWNFDAVLLMDFLPGVSPALVTCDQTRMRGATETFQHSPIAPRLLPLHRAFGTVGYSVSPQGAETLLRACFPLAPLQVFFPGLNRAVPNTGIDIPMNMAYPSIRAFVSFPPLALTRNEHSISTVLP